MVDDTLSRPIASAAVELTGWRLLLGSFAASVPVRSTSQALEVATAAAGACGEHADGHFRADVRADRVELVVQTQATRAVTALDAELVERITAAVLEVGCSIAAPDGNAGARPVQQLEIAIDTLDRARIKPFWAAALGLVDGPSPDELVDPAGQLPTVWFQDMDQPRPQRNRIHFDITVAHDEAHRRVQAALDAGGVLVSDAEARAFWVLADAEGNELCVSTWQDRDPI